MELFLLYLWLLSDTFITCLYILGVLSVVVAIFYWINSSSCLETIGHYTGNRWYDYKYKRRLAQVAYRKAVATKKWALWIGIVLLCLGTLLPGKTTIAYLVAGHFAIQVSKTPEASKFLEVIRLHANKQLDAELEKLSPKKVAQ